MKKSVILISGGLDSTTCLAYAKAQDYTCYAISFDYGQRHRAELNAAAQIARHFEVKQHEIMRLSLSHLAGSSALTNHNIPVSHFDGSKKIPTTYVPARNTVFLSIALAWAEMLHATAIFLGVSAVDYSGYPDCRPEYIHAFQKMAALATKCGVEGNPIQIETPLIHLSKAETIELGLSLGVDYSLTISCYQASDDGLACGQCDSCHLRRKGFLDLGAPDPTRYRRG